MKKSFLTFAAAGLMLSGCAVYVDGSAIDDYDDYRENSLTVQDDNGKEMTINCTDGREPFSKGGENGEPLELGCRNVAGAPDQ